VRTTAQQTAQRDGQRNTAELDERLSSRFFRRHSGAQIVFEVKSQMAFHLFGKFPLVAFALE
jgi:hypothetical protein